MSETRRPHTLLTVLGTDPKLTTYVLDGRQAEHRVATAALYELLSEGDRPDRIVAFCTPEAEKDSYPLLLESLRAHPCQVDVVRVSLAQGAMRDFLREMANSVSDADLTLDVTHGPRHFPFLMHVGALYLTALRGVRLRGFYYGLRSGSEPAPLLNVKQLVDLPLWFHAVRTLQETGSAQQVADLVRASDLVEASRVADALQALTEAHASALPIELGQLARRFLVEHADHFEQILHREDLPLAGELVDTFTGVLERQKTAQALSGTDWKGDARLDPDELRRWARVVDDFLSRRDYPNALGLMREWLVLWIMWRKGETSKWLKHDQRRRFESDLHGWDRLTDSGGMTNDQVQVGRAWRLIHKLRNQYAHHGIDKEVALSTDSAVAQSLQEIQDIWRATLSVVPKIELPRPPIGRVLVSPIGKSPGVLFSALGNSMAFGQLARCVVICTRDTEGAIEEVCRKAGYSGEVKRVRLDSPYPDEDALRNLAKAATQWVRDEGHIMVNLTGGTTLMGVLADRIGYSARHLGKRVYRFALVDERSSVEQAADPYTLGAAVWLGRRPVGAR